jgi:hypothetical protein
MDRSVTGPYLTGPYLTGPYLTEVTTPATAVTVTDRSA